MYNEVLMLRTNIIGVRLWNRVFFWVSSEFLRFVFLLIVARLWWSIFNTNTLSTSVYSAWVQFWPHSMSTFRFWLEKFEKIWRFCSKIAVLIKDRSKIVDIDQKKSRNSIFNQKTVKNSRYWLEKNSKILTFLLKNSSFDQKLVKNSCSWLEKFQKFWHF